MRSGHVPSASPCSIVETRHSDTVETRHSDTHPNRFGYVSDTYPCAPALCLEAVPEGYPFCGTPLTIIPLSVPKRSVPKTLAFAQRRRDDNKNKMFAFEDGGALGVERKIVPKRCFSWGTSKE